MLWAPEREKKGDARSWRRSECQERRDLRTILL
jgi:hypothetical protein